MYISQSAIDRAEKGKSIAMSTLIAYKEHFDVPYEALLGESEALEYENVNISMELGLTDEAIATIKKIKESPVAIEMLNIFLSKESESTMFFERLAKHISDLYGNHDYKNYLKSDSQHKNRANPVIKLKEFQIQESLLSHIDNIDDNQIKSIERKIELVNLRGSNIDDEELAEICNNIHEFNETNEPLCKVNGTVVQAVVVGKVEDLSKNDDN